MGSGGPKPSKSCQWLSILCVSMLLVTGNTINNLTEETGAESWIYTKVRVLFTIPWNNYETWQSTTAAHLSCFSEKTASPRRTSYYKKTQKSVKKYFWGEL